MDENKWEKLQEIGYRTKGCCGLCAHFIEPMNGGSVFSVCERYSYKHKKHTKTERRLSVTRYGCCPEFELRNTARFRLHKFMDLLEE